MADSRRGRAVGVRCQVPSVRIEDLRLLKAGC